MRTQADVIDAAERTVIDVRSSPDTLRDAACTLSSTVRQLQDCLRWAAVQRIGPGGIAHADLQQVMSAAARGEDWRAWRDRLDARRAKARAP